jgi:hypothetical protein
MTSFGIVCVRTEISEEYTASVFKVAWIIVLKEEDWHRDIFLHMLDISFLIRNILDL